MTRKKIIWKKKERVRDQAKNRLINWTKPKVTSKIKMRWKNK